MQDIRRWPTSPLALAVMGHLLEKPMHPYEIGYTMRKRGVDTSIKLTFGTLYHTVEQLAKSNLIAAYETGRDGRRPERTVYYLTDTGKEHFLKSLRELISQPVKEYSRFEAGLSYMHNLDRGEAVALLKERTSAIEKELDFFQYLVGALIEDGLTRLCLIETEYALMLRRAELDWVRQLIQEIESEELEWVAGFRPAPRMEARKN